MLGAKLMTANLALPLQPVHSTKCSTVLPHAVHMQHNEPVAQALSMALALREEAGSGSVDITCKAGKAVSSAIQIVTLSALLRLFQCIAKAQSHAC